MNPSRVALIGGGARSGKSAFAVELAHQLGSRRAFVATATASDDEMRARIERHRRDRADAFATVEVPIALADALAQLDGYDVVVVDCLTLWLSNLLLRGDSVDAILAQVDTAVGVLAERRFHAIVVTNEVGMSLHPTTPLGRAFVEVSGWAHQRVARASDDVYLAVLGTVVPLRHGLGPSPFAAQRSCQGS
ncbi:MAG: bifunctional adenosylcobinamide kinase/adenosylcobinamide-phosphate guanylyltransferase [Myxococcota bacterium]|nr:bifunctional adenosylcobinamide kinase/adenosylcobinamide-phosphate guanylyltransferase [Myxococcota bacterium]